MAEARTAGCSDPADVIANAIGLMFQSYTATAALIGACLLAIARHPETRGPVASDPARLRALIQEVLRCDPSTNNTIRFAARDGVIAGQPMRQGDVIIVSLAAASRDPRLNRDPDTFDLDRRDRRYLEFGAGRHACPADKLAPLMAEVAVSHLLGAGVPLESLASSVRYAPSAFVRAPTWLPVS